MSIYRDREHEAARSGHRPAAQARLDRAGWFAERSPGHKLVDGFFAENHALYFVVREPDDTYALMRLEPHGGSDYPIARTGSADLDELLDIAERLSQMHVGIANRRR